MMYPTFRRETYRHAAFFEETYFLPEGDQVRVRRSPSNTETSRGCSHYAVSLNGKRVDSALSLTQARERAKFVFGCVCEMRNRRMAA